MNSARIAYTPRPNTDPAAELNALTAVYSFCVQKHRESQKVVRPTPEPNDRDGTEVQGDSAYVQIIP